MRKRPEATAGSGFSLVELLVAVAVLMILMGGFTLLFSGSVRTVRSSMQQVDANDLASGAIASLKHDLTGSFNSGGLGGAGSFYGTPIGMTFIGVTQNVSPYHRHKPHQADYRTARITYVLYSDKNGPYQMFPEAFLEEIAPGQYSGVRFPAFTHKLIRYVEPNETDLDSFPVQWDAEGVLGENYSLSDLIDGMLLEILQERPDLLNHVEETTQALKRELWIRMLAGGDHEVPNAWAPENHERILGRPPHFETNVHDFVLLDGVATLVPPYDIPYMPSVPPGYESDPFLGAPLFSYDYSQPGPYAARNHWWNDRRSVNCWDGAGYCSDERLPEIVSAAFWLMFPAVHPASPHFQRRYTTTLHVPAAFSRSAVISGHVYGPIPQEGLR